MEQNTINNSFSSNGNSLQLRSKEVVEVMGNIPSWIGSWGAFLIVFLFSAHCFFIFNIHFVERIPGKVTVSSKHIQPLAQQDLFLKVAIPSSEYSKIKTRESLSVSFGEEHGTLYKLNVIKFPSDKMKFNKNSCVAELSLNPCIIDKMPLNTPANVNCQILVSTSIFQKVMTGYFDRNILFLMQLEWHKIKKTANKLFAVFNLFDLIKWS
jgi:hypothetical protein